MNRDAFIYCLKVFLAVRIGLTLVAMLGVGLLPVNEPAPVPGWEGPDVGTGLSSLATAWERWDVLWFLRIASEGYSATDGSAAFFPLYPLLVGMLSFVLGGYLSAAIVVSNAAFLGALYVVYRLTEDEFGDSTARRTILYLAVFPASYFFIAPYSESLFLLLSASCLWAARRDRWGVAAVTGALASATRNVGLLLIPALVAQALIAYRASRESSEKKGLLLPLGASALVAAGAFGYLAFWSTSSAGWLAPFEAQGNWLREFSFAPSTVLEGTRLAFSFLGIYPGGFHMLDWLIVIPMIVAAGWVVVRTPLPYRIYTALSLLVPLSFVFGSRPFMSVPRFMVVVFPLFWALARFTERFRVHEAVVALSAGLLGLMTVLFVNWYWVF
jgi:Mannosyltransferase (PIG-V)